MTLITCTPYAVNTHRLLVRGHRVPYEEALKKEPDRTMETEVFHREGMLILTAFLAVAVLIIVGIYGRPKSGRKKKSRRKRNGR